MAVPTRDVRSTTNKAPETESVSQRAGSAQRSPVPNQAISTVQQLQSLVDDSAKVQKLKAMEGLMAKQGEDRTLSLAAESQAVQLREEENKPDLSDEGTSKNIGSPWRRRLRLMSLPMPALAGSRAGAIFRDAHEQMRRRVKPKRKEFDNRNLNIDIAMLEKHIGAKASQQKLVAGEKHGQGMAEQLARGGDGTNNLVNNFTGEAVAPKVMSQTLMDLVKLTKYDDTASASVLELANGDKDLQDEQMWNLVVVNSKFMSYIRPGMKINKIIPDSTIQNILKTKQNSSNGTRVGGSVAHEMNYNQELTGEEATANFGLDYGGYLEDTLNAHGTLAKKSELSSYVYKTDVDVKGRTLKAVPNVFYIKVAIPDNRLDDVKVPVHGNIMRWAEEKLSDIEKVLYPPQTSALGWGKHRNRTLMKALGKKVGANNREMYTSLSKKFKILTRFIDRAKVDENMLTTLTADQKKNKEDPLTNMGMTKPGSRLQTEFGTINQEYHIKGPIDVPQGSGLWLKDATGVDKLVGQFISNPENSNKLEWGDLNTDLIQAKLAENEALRHPGTSPQDA